jgi:hypothetical protein
MNKIDERGVITSCDECNVEIRKKILAGEMIGGIDNQNKESILGVVFRTFWMSRFNEHPRLGRTTITEKLVNHGQFTQEEIDSFFEEHSYLTRSYSDEFLKENPRISRMRYFYNGEELPKEKKYNLPWANCDDKIELNLCVMQDVLKKYECPACGNEFFNTPSNLSLRNDLVCHACFTNRFLPKGVILKGDPVHHGNWDDDGISFEYDGTDYFSIYHSACNNGRKGLMKVIAVWCDDRERIVLSLECEACGKQNAIKPNKLDEQIPLLNWYGAPWKLRKLDIEELISQNENEKLEFKSSMMWDYEKERKNKDLEYMVAKTITSFLNSGSGTLLIGVDDDGRILGLHPDYILLGDKGNPDGFELHLNNIIYNYIGGIYRQFISVEFPLHNGEEICVISVKKSDHPILLKKRGRVEFIIRSGNGTKKLSELGEIKTYINRNWPFFPEIDFNTIINSL